MPIGVSVVVTTYNQSAYIAATIQSVLDQTCEPLEIIVVDDGSTDDTVGALTPFLSQIAYVRQVRAGVAGSRNSGIARAKGDLVALLDGDDLWDPSKLECQVAAFERHPDAGLVATGVRHFSDETTLWSSSFDRFFAERSEDVVCASCYREFTQDNLIPTTSQVMIPRRVLHDVGPSDPSFRGGSDYDLYLRIAKHFPFVFLRRPLASWRYVSTSVSGADWRREFNWHVDAIAVLRKHLTTAIGTERRWLSEGLRRRVRQASRRAYDRGVDHDRAWARRYLAVLGQTGGTSLAPYVYLAALYAPRGLVRSLGPAVSRWLAESDD